jgi:hypothetical protein
MKEATTSGTKRSIPVVPDPAVHYGPGRKDGSSYKVRAGEPATRPGASEYERFESLMKRLVSVPKKEIDARRDAERKRR